MKIGYEKLSHRSKEAIEHKQSTPFVSNSPSASIMTLYSADGLTAIQRETPIGESGFPLMVRDDDLTSLSWLQSANLLEDKTNNRASNAAIGLQSSSPEIDLSTIDAAAAILSLKHGSSTASVKELMEGNNHLRSSVIHSTSSQAPITISPYNAFSFTTTGALVNRSTELEKEIPSGELDEPEENTTNGIPGFPSARKSVELSSLFLYQFEESTEVDYDPKIHIKHKPPYPLSYVIFMAINESPTKYLFVKEIYDWISINFPHFQKYKANSWKSTVKQNLTCSKYFRKVDNTNLGKGSLWTIVKRYAPRLEKGIQKINSNDSLMKLIPEKEYGNGSRDSESDEFSEECQDDLEEHRVAVNGASGIFDLAGACKRKRNGDSEEIRNKNEFSTNTSHPPCRLNENGDEIIKSEIRSQSFNESSDSENKCDEIIPDKRNKNEDTSRLPLKLPFKKDKRKWEMSMTT